jgi:hypothetical protein
MKTHILARILYIVSAKEMTGLLLWNTGNITHIAKDPKLHSKFCGRPVPSHKLMQDMNNNGVEKVMF